MASPTALRIGARSPSRASGSTVRIGSAFAATHLVTDGPGCAACAAEAAGTTLAVVMPTTASSVSGRHLSLTMPAGFEAFFEEVADLATPSTDPRNTMSQLTTVAARYAVELLGPPRSPT